MAFDDVLDALDNGFSGICRSKVTVEFSCLMLGRANGNEEGFVVGRNASSSQPPPSDCADNGGEVIGDWEGTDWECAGPKPGGRDTPAGADGLNTGAFQLGIGGGLSPDSNMPVSKFVSLARRRA